MLKPLKISFVMFIVCVSFVFVGYSITYIVCFVKGFLHKYSGYFAQNRPNILVICTKTAPRHASSGGLGAAASRHHLLSNM